MNQPIRRTASLLGHDVSYLEHRGQGAPLVMLHGVGSSISTWGDIPLRLAAEGRTVVAVDLLGHGDSGTGNGDFSLGAHASAVRDLLDHLGYSGRVHLVGHSLGGGVSLQFAYQFPDRVESLTLVSSGGLGPDVGIGLRAASLPGSELVLRAASSERVLGMMSRMGRGLRRVGIDSEVLSPNAIEKLTVLRDETRRAAFLSTVRSVVGPDGQRVSALDKMGGLDPRRVLIVWGECDPMIPIQHGLDAHALLPGSTFVVVPGAAHHPHSHSPELVTREILRHTDERVVAR
jgi:pimeloyl-ACP methyl ester carboxylesterase